MLILQRLLASALSVLLFAGSGAVCAGWAPTPEGRMECCVDGNCPMHRRERETDKISVTQAQADSCCASSEDIPASEVGIRFGSMTVALPVDPGLLVLVAVPLPLRDGAWHSPPVPIDPVPKHVLFSVYLV